MQQQLEVHLESKEFEAHSESINDMNSLSDLVVIPDNVAPEAAVVAVPDPVAPETSVIAISDPDMPEPVVIDVPDSVAPKHLPVTTTPVATGFNVSFWDEYLVEDPDFDESEGPGELSESESASN